MVAGGLAQAEGVVDEVAVGMGGGNGLEAAGSSGRVSMELRTRPGSGRSVARVGGSCGKRASRADEDWNPRRAERERERRGDEGRARREQPLGYADLQTARRESNWLLVGQETLMTGT